MKILIIGATGRLGRCLVEQALAAGFTVTGLARSPEPLQLAHEHLSVAKGDLFDACAPQLFESATIQSISNLDAPRGMIERC